MKTINFVKNGTHFITQDLEGYGRWLCSKHTIDEFGLSKDCDGFYATISTVDGEGFNAITMRGEDGHVVLPNGNTHWLMDAVRVAFIKEHGTESIKRNGLPTHDITLYVKIEEYKIVKTLRMCNLNAKSYQF